MVTWKDMEHLSLLMETDTWGNGVMIRNTGMEYTDRLVDMYITESGNRATEMVKDISGSQMERNIGDSTRIT